MSNRIMLINGRHAEQLRVAVAARATVSMRVILPDCDATFVDYGIFLEGTDFSWLQE